MLFAATHDRATSAEDRKAVFDGLVRSSHRQAYNLAYRLTGCAAEAEDLAQEAYVRAFRFFGRYDDSLPFTSWLFRIMTNAHIDMLRRKGKLKTTSLQVDSSDNQVTREIPDTESMPDRILVRDSLNDHIQAAVNSMTTEFKHAVILADIEGLAYEEIAELMNTSVGTVRSRIHRGRKQIRKYLLAHAPETYKEFCNELS